MCQFGCYETEKRIRMAAVIFSIIAAIFVVSIIGYKENVNARVKLQENLAEEVLRFHVLANSDSEEDQALKMKVKEGILSYLEGAMPEMENVSETSEWVRNHTDALEEVSGKIIAQEGYEYTVSAAVTTCWFPQKTYGDVTFPQGNYKALRIEIGEAEGQNWWCVLYPGLCFLDAANAVFPDEGKKRLKDVLTEEEYSSLTVGKEFQIGFYFLENILTL
ncbi:MAG: stage II sporulation protein R [Schaedlerella sp.]|nr:stage II sporulation protein R [Schaedlerella sp.]